MVSWILFGVFITAHLVTHVLDLVEEYECQRHYKEYIKINVVHQQYFTNNGIHA